MNSFLKYLFYFSILFFLFSSGWYFSWSDHLLFFKILKYFIYFLLLSILLIYLLKKKKFNFKFVIMIIFFLIGQKTYINNYFGLNNFIYSSLMQIKYNPLGYHAFKLKEILLGTFNIKFSKTKIKEFNIENIQINSDELSKLILSVDNIGNFLLKKNDNNEFKLTKFISSVSEDQNLTPIYLDENKIFLIKNHVSHKTIVSSLLYYEILNDNFYKRWALESNEIGFHHWGDYYNGFIYVPGRDFVSLPNEYSKKFFNSKYSKCNLDNSWNEFISIHDIRNSKLINKIYIMPLLSDIENNEFDKYLFKCMNPIHFNDIQIIKSHKHASYFENGKIGDILISLRNIHTIALIDKDNYKIKWSVSGLFNQQHSPRVTDRGTILLFDNLGSDKKYGKSRVVEVSIKNRKILDFYEGSKGDFFESIQRGRLQIYEGKIFIQNHEAGELFYLDCGDLKFVSNRCKKKNVLKADNFIFNFTDVLN